MPDEKVFLVAGDKPYVPNSIRVYCHRCGAEGFISPTGQDRLAEGAVIICLSCFKARQFSMNQIAEVTEEQLDEIKKVLGFRPGKKTVMRKLEEFLRRRDEQG